MNEADMMELRECICRRQGWECVCGAMVYPASCQLAHRIPQRKHMLKRYGKAVIHHPRNLVAVCSLRCNDSVSIGGNPIAIQRLVEEIREELET